MKRFLRYCFFLIVLIPLLALFSTSTTGCDPHRRGSVVKPVGGSGAAKRHHSPASAKRKRKYYKK